MGKEKIWWKVTEFFHNKCQFVIEHTNVSERLWNQHTFDSFVWIHAACKVSANKKSLFQKAHYAHTQHDRERHFSFEKKKCFRFYWWVCYQDLTAVSVSLNILQICNNLTHYIVGKCPRALCVFHLLGLERLHCQTASWLDHLRKWETVDSTFTLVNPLLGETKTFLWNWDLMEWTDMFVSSQADQVHLHILWAIILWWISEMGNR